MEPMITGEERDALLAGLEGRRARPGDGGMRRYNFRSPDKFSKDQFRTLVTLHDNFARGAMTALSAHLRTMVEIRTETVEQMTYRQFTQAVGEPAILAVVAVPPLPARALWSMEPAMAFFMIDRLLGGPGAGPEKARPLTDIEITVVRRLFVTLFSAWREAWRIVENVAPRLEDIESNALFAQVAAPDDIVLVIKHSVEAAGRSGLMYVCLPYRTLEPVLPRLSARGWLAHEPSASRGDRQRILEHILETRVSVTVELGRARLSMGRFLSLKPGDVVRLDRGPDDPLPAYMGPVPAFQGRPGTRGRRMALTVESMAAEAGRG